MSSFWIPIRITHVIFVGQVFLWSPHFFRAMRILLRWVWPIALGDVDLVLCHQVVQSGILLVFKPCVGHSKIVIWMNTNRQLTWNWIPRILMHLPDWCITISHLSHFIISSCWPEYFYLFSFRVGNDLSTNICLICFIEYINSHVNNHVGIVDLLNRIQAKLLNTKTFTTSESWNSTH